jgi:hypothetical protein
MKRVSTSLASFEIFEQGVHLAIEAVQRQIDGKRAPSRLASFKILEHGVENTRCHTAEKGSVTIFPLVAFQICVSAVNLRSGTSTASHRKQGNKT